MKVIAYLTFVISVLLVSAFAQADDLMSRFFQNAVLASPVAIDQITVAPTKTQLTVIGDLPNPCYSQPSGYLTLDDSSRNTLILHIASSASSGNCIQAIQSFSSVINLSTLVQDAQLQLDQDTQYLIKAEGFEFEITLKGVELIP